MGGAIQTDRSDHVFFIRCEIVHSFRLGACTGALSRPTVPITSSSSVVKSYTPLGLDPRRNSQLSSSRKELVIEDKEAPEQHAKSADIYLLLKSSVPEEKHERSGRGEIRNIFRVLYSCQENSCVTHTWSATLFCVLM